MKSMIPCNIHQANGNGKQLCISKATYIMSVCIEQKQTCLKKAPDANTIINDNENRITVSLEFLHLFACCWQLGEQK